MSKLNLFWLSLVVKKRNFVDYLKTVAHYYSNLTFMKADLLLLSHYLFKSPYKISKEFLQKRREEEVYAYGETPLTTLDLISKECQINKRDTVFELGCGRGRSCFWLNTILGCKVVGLEYIPEFVEIAEKVKTTCGLENLTFRCENFLETNFEGATVIYLYGTCLEDDFIKKLSAKFAKLPAGTKIITVSYPLSDYADNSHFTLMKRFSAPFTWGEADVYLHLLNVELGSEVSRKR